MNGRDFLLVARELARGRTEAHWRAAAGRAYYAAMLGGRAVLAQWGFVPTRYDNVHSFVRLRFQMTTDADLKLVGRWLENLGRLRNRADYDMSPGVWFATAAAAIQAGHDAAAALNLLDQIDADPARKAAAVSAVQTAFGP